MLLEEQRALHEDLERLEQAIADRLLDDSKHVRDRLARDHEISSFLDRIEDQSKRLLEIYEDRDGNRAKEIQTISTGDHFDSFYKELNSIKDFHRRYPNETVENLERAYKRQPGEWQMASTVDSMFTGEERWGQFLDLVAAHEEYLNLPGVKNHRRPTYLQYLDQFDNFALIKRSDKMTDEYFQYLGGLANYLESFLRRVRPLENHNKLFADWDHEFESAWEQDSIEGWRKQDLEAEKTDQAKPATQGTGSGIWCADCEKEFSNENVYKHHLTQKKHLKNAAAMKANGADGAPKTNGTANHTSGSANRLKERAIASREFRIKKLASALQTTRSDTSVNVERKAGMTDRERQQELAALFEETSALADSAAAANGGDSDDEGEEKIYNPLKLPLAWDGKPIPFWLYKLHGLGVEFPCEICGNFVYMGRRAFDKHFNEARHIYGLKCLGITNTTLFREITGIEEAVKLWEKLQRDRKEDKGRKENVVQMEDKDGNVMPEKVYYDLQKQGLL